MLLGCTSFEIIIIISFQNGYYICSMQVLLLMSTALNVQIPEPPAAGVGDTLATDLRTRQQSIAEITEMIHVSSSFF